VDGREQKYKSAAKLGLGTLLEMKGKEGRKEDIITVWEVEVSTLHERRRLEAVRKETTDDRHHAWCVQVEVGTYSAKSEGCRVQQTQTHAQQDA